MTLTFANSGTGESSITLDAVAEMALDLGFHKEGSQAIAKKPSQRADLQRFFQTYGVKAFTPFKEKFAREKLLPPEEHLEQLKKVSRCSPKRHDPNPHTDPDTSLARHPGSTGGRSQSATGCLPFRHRGRVRHARERVRSGREEVEALQKVRIQLYPCHESERGEFDSAHLTTPSPYLSHGHRPGGVATRSLLYYDITGARKQVETGDLAVECPQWNEVGAVDYVGKAHWEGHNKWKGKTTTEARAVFCKLFNDAKAERSKHFF